LSFLTLFLCHFTSTCRDKFSAIKGIEGLFEKFYKILINTLGLHTLSVINEPIFDAKLSRELTDPKTGKDELMISWIVNFY